MVEDEYAYALFELGKENNKLEIFSENFVTISETITIDNFLSILSNASIKRSTKKEMVKNVYHNLDEDFIYFLYVLIDHSRINLIFKISDAYKTLVLTESNSLKASVVSAYKLNNKALNKIEALLEKRYEGKNIVLTNIIDESLIGGIKVIVNNEALDLSLKNSLDRLKDSV